METNNPPKRGVHEGALTRLMYKVQKTAQFITDTKIPAAIANAAIHHASSRSNLFTSECKAIPMPKAWEAKRRRIHYALFLTSIWGLLRARFKAYCRLQIQLCHRPEVPTCPAKWLAPPFPEFRLARILLTVSIFYFPVFVADSLRQGHLRHINPNF